MAASASISIDRTSLSLPPLVCAGSRYDGADWVIKTKLVQPGKVARIVYMPDEPDVHGSQPVAASWQQGLLSFDVAPAAFTEQAMVNLVTQLEAALGQFSYQTTVTISGVATVWNCDMGSVEQVNGRAYVDLLGHNPRYAVTIPVYPVPVSL